MTQVLQIVGIVVTVLGAVVYVAASFGQMRAAREREIEAKSTES